MTIAHLGCTNDTSHHLAAFLVTAMNRISNLGNSGLPTCVSVRWYRWSLMTMLFFLLQTPEPRHAHRFDDSFEPRLARPRFCGLYAPTKACCLDLSLLRLVDDGVFANAEANYNLGAESGRRWVGPQNVVLDCPGMFPDKGLHTAKTLACGIPKELFSYDKRRQAKH